MIKVHFSLYLLLMSNPNFIFQFLFRGVFASYLLLFSLEIHQHQDKYTELILSNTSNCANIFSFSLADHTLMIIKKILPYYCQLLAAVSLAVVCGFKIGHKIGCVLALLNLFMLWSNV